MVELPFGFRFEPDAPDLTKYPDAWRGDVYNVVLEEGQTVLLPRDWWHWAKALTPSITLMRNFVAHDNEAEFTRLMAKEQLPAQ